MISKVTFISLLLIVIVIDLAQTSFTDVPPPPSRPEHFQSKEEIIRYLRKVREYYLITGKRIFRRHSDDHSDLSTSDDDLFRFFDLNNDRHISEHEFAQRLNFQKPK